jgi:hypothetical protein
MCLIKSKVANKREVVHVPFLVTTFRLHPSFYYTDTLVIPQLLKLLELNLPSLEERRLQADMVQTFKIVKGIDRVDHRTWFQLAADGGRATRSADCPLNLRQKAARLGGVSNRVIDNWNMIPSSVKNARSVTSFKKHRKDMVSAT